MLPSSSGSSRESLERFEHRPPSSGTTATWDAAGIFALALAVRLLHVLALRDSPLFAAAHPPWDDYFFVNAAQNVAAGAPWRGEELAWVSSPPYVGFLSAIFWASGRDVLIPRLIQATAGATVPALLYGMGRRLYGRTAGIVSGLGAALYGPMVFYDGELLPASFAVLGTTAALFLLLSARTQAHWGLALAGGLVLGLATQLRFNLALFLPVALLWLVLGSAGTPRRRATVAAAFALGAALVLGPYVLRGAIVGTGPVPFAHGLGIHVYIGNHAEANGTYIRVPGVASDARGHVVDAAHIAEAAIGHPVRPAEVSRYWLAKSLDFIARNPLHFVSLTARKVRLFLNAYEIPSNEDFGLTQRFSPPLRAAALPYAIVCPLGLLGLLLPAKDRWGHGLLAAFAATYLLALIPLFVTAHYRLPVAPVWLLLGGRATVWLHRRARARAWPQLVAGITALTAFALLVNAPTPLSRERYEQKAERQIERLSRDRRQTLTLIERGGIRRALEVGQRHMSEGNFAEAARVLRWAEELSGGDPNIITRRAEAEALAAAEREPQR